jgi:hypothetical protein
VKEASLRKKNIPCFLANAGSTLKIRKTQSRRGIMGGRQERVMGR